IVLPRGWSQGEGAVGVSPGACGRYRTGVQKRRSAAPRSAAGQIDHAFAAFRRDGDTDALARVFVGVAPRLLRRARRMLGDANAAEDVVQELFLSLLHGENGYDPRRPCMPFLLGALHRHAARWRRRRARLPVAVEQERAGGDDPAALVAA